MGRRPGVTKKKNQENKIIDLSLKNQFENENPFSKSNNVTTQVMTELTKGVSVENKTLAIVNSLRRSPRLHNATSSSQNTNIQTMVEYVEACDTEEKEDHPSGLTDRAKKDTRKLDELSKLIEDKRKTIEGLASKIGGKSFLARLAIKIKYKNMYMDSQKKICELKQENYELTKKLVCAHAKLEGHEKGQHVFSGVIDRLKDVLFLSTLTKTTETALGFSSSRAVDAPRAAKRKKANKGEAQVLKKLKKKKDVK